MMPATRALAVTTLLCLMPLHGAVAAAYKWTDDKGEVHYSQTPPTATKVEVIKTPSSTYSAPTTSSPQTSNAADTSDSNEGDDATRSPEAAKAEDAAIRDKNCTAARSNLKTLKNAGEITVKDAQGLLHSLTPEERKSRTAEAERIIKEYCKE